jgi:hypothetical protein
MSGTLFLRCIMSVRCCHPYIAQLAFWHRRYGCPLLCPLKCFDPASSGATSWLPLSGPCIASAALWSRPYRCALLSTLHCFTCLLSPPLWLSSAAAPTLLPLPFGVAPVAVRCSGPCFSCCSSALCSCPYCCPTWLQPPSIAPPLWLSTIATPAHCFTGLLSMPLWLSTVATPVHCCTVLLMPNGGDPVTVHYCHPCTLLHCPSGAAPVTGHCCHPCTLLHLPSVAAPKRLSTVATPVHCFTGLLAPSL